LLRRHSAVAGFWTLRPGNPSKAVLSGCENRRLKGGGYGNAFFSRFPLTVQENFDLSQSRKEERGCLRTDIALSPTKILHVFNIHLGTAYLERRRQVHKLMESEILTGSGVIGPRILLGDFNEWLPGPTLRLLQEHFGRVDLRANLDRRRTYPGPFPLFYLDHIYFDDSLELRRAMAYRTTNARGGRCSFYSMFLFGITIYIL
jgi:endonuclease/exonuclease/phosphatase family metal-dependent hydrolase